jgi:hypothetical protein
MNRKLVVIGAVSATLLFVAGLVVGRAITSGDEHPQGSRSTSVPTVTTPPTDPRPPADVASQPDPASEEMPRVGGDEVFVATFDDGQGLERFRTGVFHREVDAFEPPRPEWIDTTPWQADHDIALDDCGDPQEHHHLVSTADGDAASFYVCRDHMMTSMGHVSGYSVAWFAPDQTFDSISEVCWDVNISSDVLGHRQWWEVTVSPADMPDVNAIDWIAGTANLPTYGATGAVVLGFGPDNPPHPKISVGDTVVGRGGTTDPEARGSVAIRRPHCFSDDGAGTLTYSSLDGDGSPYSFDAPGAFPPGPLKIVFKDHNYTPDKDCEHMPGRRCQSYTWHWDNIVVRR